MSDHFIAHFELDTSLPRDLLLKWEAGIEAWEQDKTQPNPFTLKMAITTLSRIEEQTAAAQKKPLHAYTVSLWLQSQIGTKLTFDLHLAEIGWKLRVAQAYEALETLRSHLQIRSHLFKFKDRFVWGQHANTCACNTIDTVQAKIQSAAEEYRSAYKALDSLSVLLGNERDVGNINPGNWRTTLFSLEPSNIRKLSEAENESISEGRRKISWIWKILGVSGDDSEDLHD
ncbi:hypothetical protein C0993_008223, partial [Termitomyces sp. T159_Od127]